MWVVFFFLRVFLLSLWCLDKHTQIFNLFALQKLAFLHKQTMDGWTRTVKFFFLLWSWRFLSFFFWMKEKNWRKNTDYFYTSSIGRKHPIARRKKLRIKIKKTLSTRGKRNKKGFHCRRCHWILVKMLLWAAKFCDSKSKEFTSFSCLYIWKQCNWISKWTWFKLCIEFNACTRMSVCSLHRISLYVQRKREKKEPI